MFKSLSKYWPILFIVVLWFLFASPYFLKNLVPFPSDYLVNNFAPWSAYPGFAGPVKNAATPDVITQIFPWKKLVIDIWKAGIVPLWNPYAFSGTPLLANYQSAVLTPLNLLYFILPFIDAWSIQILLQPLLAGLFMYLYTRSLKLSSQGSLISSISFMFCGFITGWMVYGTLGYAILFLPLALFSIEKYYQTKKWYFATLLSLTIPLSLFSGHFQTSIYFLIFVVAYCLFKFIQTKNLKSMVLSLTSVLFGLLLCGPQLLPSIEFYGAAVRSSTFTKTEVIPWAYLPTFFAPDFFGNSVTRNDWFGHYAEWNAYIGLLPLMLAFYSLRKRTALIIFFVAAGLIALLFAFQTPLQDLLFALKIPVLSTSAASRIVVLFSFSFSVLAGFGFENLIEDVKNRKLKPIMRWVLVFVLIFIALWLVAYLKLFFPGDKYLIARSNLKFPTIILLVALLAIIGSLFLKNKKVLIILPLILILISAFDVYRFAAKWQTFQPKNLVYPEVPVSKFLTSISGPYRVFGNFGAEASTTYRIPSVEGYDPLYNQRYGEFLEAAQDGLYHEPPRSAVFLSKNGQFTSEAINILGIKYFVHKMADDRQVWTFPVWAYPVERFKIVYQDSSYKVFENQQAFPRAFFVQNYKIVTDKRKILAQMFADETDLSKTAILEENPGETGVNNSGSAKIANYSSNNIRIDTNSSDGGLLVLSDPYYPGWKAQVDGRETKIYRADYAFRAIKVAKGKHIVTFTYDPDSFKMGLGIGMLGLVGVLGESIYIWKKKSQS